MYHPTSLILLGYWAESAADPRWPRPDDFVRPDWDPNEREMVVDYLSRGFVARSYMGVSPCRMCGQDNGSLELTDGVFVCPKGWRTTCGITE